MGISLQITLACLYTTSRVYWVLSMGRRHQTPHLAHVVLLAVISSFHSSVKLYYIEYIYTWVIFQSQHVIKSLNPISSEFSISCSKHFTFFCACSVMFYFNFNLSYMLSTFQILTHTCATSSRDVGSDSQHPDHA